jgi:ferredoxin
VLAGWASNSKYALLGGLRSTAQLISYELTLALSILGVLVIAGTFDLRAMIASQDSGVWSWHVFRQPVGCLFFLVAGFAETNRLPFDLPEGESELGAGFHTEYSSMKWAVFMMAEYLHILTFAAIMTTLFLGGFHGPLAPPEGVELGALAAALSGLFWFSLKVGAIFFVFVHVRGTLPRLRYDQLMALGWKYMLPLALVNVVITAGIVAAGDVGCGDGRGAVPGRMRAALPDGPLCGQRQAEGGGLCWLICSRAFRSPSGTCSRRRSRWSIRRSSDRRRRPSGASTASSATTTGWKGAWAARFARRPARREAIYLEAKENDPASPVSAGERYASKYQIHYLRCIWCGFCEEACPEDAIVMGPEFELANFSRSSMIMNKEDMLDPPEKGFGEQPKLKVNYPL